MQVNFNPLRSNVQQSCTSLRSIRNIHPSNTDDLQESTNDTQPIESLPSAECIQPTATKILSSAKTSTLQKIIESLPEENEVVVVDEPKEPDQKIEEEESKKEEEAIKEVLYFELF